MSVEWNSLPLLPLRCILDHLSVENALAATSTCRHWRQAMLLYEGHRESLVLVAKQLEKNLFLTRLFRKHVTKLHIYIDCNEEQLNKFMSFVLPQFLDTIKLEEVIFIGPAYMHLNPLMPLAKLKRIITESLVFKHSNVIQKFGIMGCEVASVKDDKDRFVHKQLEFHSKPLSFECLSPADAILTRCNVEAMMFSTLQHVMLEYELVSTEALETLAHLNNLTCLTLNIVFKRQMALPIVDWHCVNAVSEKRLAVAINIINLPHRKFKAVLENVFVEGMTLVSLKVMFCKTIYLPLISHVCCAYNASLREVVWADGPHDGAGGTRTVRCNDEELALLSDVYNQVNPFILLCWQCVNLRRLAIHGYWIWQYDLLGFVRLRKSLQLEISSLFPNNGRFGSGSLDGECALRVMRNDAPISVDASYIQEINSFSEHEWQPIPWRRLPSGLRARSSAEQRAHYALTEVLRPLGVT